MSDRETADLFLGHPDYIGAMGVRDEGVDRFEVYVVYVDGVPRRLSVHDHLVLALEERDREIATHQAEGFQRSRFHVGVTDKENPECGDLDYDDLDE